MIPVRALVLTGYGLNCDYETDYSLKMAGAESYRVHINELIMGEKWGSRVELDHYDILVLVDTDTALTASEIAAIQAWVGMGGSLFVIGEGSDAFNDASIDTLLEPYGIDYEVGTDIDDWYDFFIAGLSDLNR